MVCGAEGTYCQCPLSLSDDSRFRPDCEFIAAGLDKVEAPAAGEVE